MDLRRFFLGGETFPVERFEVLEEVLELLLNCFRFLTPTPPFFNAPSTVTVLICFKTLLSAIAKNNTE